MRMQLPPPISLSSHNDLSYQHFFSQQANWLIPNHVLVGEAPIEPYHRHAIRHVAKCTIQVCLQAEAVLTILSTTEYEWLGGYRDVPEVPTMPQDVEFMHKSGEKDTEKDQVEKIFHYGIRDMDIAASLSSLEELVQTLVKELENGEVLYIHCMAGKGRTGLVAACLLLVCYPTMHVEEALRRVSEYCALRKIDDGENCGYLSPETEEQKQQVIDFKKWVRSKKEGSS